jgi:hypothetical protein
MHNLWIKIGCFLTGYNYQIIKNSSEASAKAVKKYLSAILIVATLWGFIGYAFTQRYLHGGPYMCIIAAIIMVIMVIQIERQITLTVGRNTWALSFRVLIGVVMAIIGSVILDQVIFKDDVEKQKIENQQIAVNKIMPVKTQELKLQIQQLDTLIQAKENEKAVLIDELGKNPNILSYSSTIQSQKDSTGRVTHKNKTELFQPVRNPKWDLVPQLESQLKLMRQEKAKKENNILNIQQLLETEIKSKVGFLDELTVLFSILFSSGIALFVWILLFCFFLAIELFVLVNKLGDTKNDYDQTILHQMDTRIKILDQLSE